MAFVDNDDVEEIGRISHTYWIDWQHAELCVREQCCGLGLSRSNLNYVFEQFLYSLDPR